MSVDKTGLFCGGNAIALVFIVSMIGRPLPVFGHRVCCYFVEISKLKRRSKAQRTRRRRLPLVVETTLARGEGLSEVVDIHCPVTQAAVRSKSMPKW